MFRLRHVWGEELAAVRGYARERQGERSHFDVPWDVFFSPVFGISGLFGTDFLPCFSKIFLGPGPFGTEIGISASISASQFQKSYGWFEKIGTTT